MKTFLNRHPIRLVLRHVSDINVTLDLHRYRPCGLKICQELVVEIPTGPKFYCKEDSTQLYHVVQIKKAYTTKIL